MAKTINIKIADNLSPEQEAFAIGKQLAKRALSSGGANKAVKRLGNEINVTDLKTTIVIERVSTEKPITFQPCNVCGCEYASNTAVYYYHNYGGTRKKRAVCSTKCQQFMVDNFGVRVAKSASKLPNPINYFKH